MAFLLYALKAYKVGTGVKNIKFWSLIVLCGLSLGFYFLVWEGVIIFLFIIFLFLAIYSLIEFICKKPVNWILISGALIFIISFLMIVPLFGHPDLNYDIYNIYHLIAFGLGLLGFLFIWIFTLVFEKKSIKKRWNIILALIIFFILFFLILKLISPDIFSKFLMLANGPNTNGAPSASIKSDVSEMISLGYQGAINVFLSFFFFFIIGFFIIFYNFLKDRKPEHLLFIIWSILYFLY